MVDIVFCVTPVNILNKKINLQTFKTLLYLVFTMNQNDFTWYNSSFINILLGSKMYLKKIIPTLLMALAFSANAEVPLTKADLLGEWKVDKESLTRNVDDDVAADLNTTWTFLENGIMEGVSIDTNKHARIGKLQASVKYRVEEGKLVKQAAPGRSKEETCVADTKEGNKMILKCGNIYFFMTKQ